VQHQLFVVAFNRPGFICSAERAGSIDHAAAIWPTIDQVAQEDDPMFYAVEPRVPGM